MLADAGGKIGEVYGVYDAESGVGLRCRFLIDPDGVIQAMEVLTPYGWHPGQIIPNPGPDLVGKVWQVWRPDTVASAILSGTERSATGVLGGPREEA